MKVIYCAGKFRGPNGWAVAENIRAAERLGFEVAQLGAAPLIPHANTASFDRTLDDKFWIDATLELLRRCDAIILVPGWEHSVGACGEKTEAERLGLPVFFAVGELREWLAGGAS
jgi:hypothetical protein